MNDLPKTTDNPELGSDALLGDRVPRTDEAVIAKLTEDTEPGPFRDAAIGLFRVRRAKGGSVLAAYEDTLRAMIGEGGPEPPNDNGEVAPTSPATKSTGA